MTVAATLRPAEWELPLFLHVLGAMVMVGALVLALVYVVPAWRGGAIGSLWNGFRALLYAALPAFLVMRISAQWLADEEGYTGDEVPDWIDLGFMVSDVGLLVMAVATTAAGLALRRARRGDGQPGPAGARVAVVLVSLLIVAYLIAIWAMTTQPG